MRNNQQITYNIVEVSNNLDREVTFYVFASNGPKKGYGSSNEYLTKAKLRAKRAMNEY